MNAKHETKAETIRRPRGLRLGAALAAALGLALAGRAEAPRLINYQGRVSVGGVNFDGWGWFKFALVGAAEENVQATALAMGFDAEGGFMAVDVIVRGSGYTAAPAVTVVSGSGAGAVLEADVENGEVTGIRVIEVGAGYQDHDTTIQIGPPQAVPPPPPCYWSNTDRDPQTGEPYGAVGLPVSKGLYAVLLGDTALANMWEIPAAVFTNADVRLRVWFDDDVHGSQRLVPDQRLAAAAYALEAHSAATARSVPDGSVTEAKLAMGAVTTMKIADGAVTGGAIGQNTIGAYNLQDGAVTGAKLAREAADPGQVLKWNGTVWAPADDLGSGGLDCMVHPTATNATISGGYLNDIGADAWYATVAGGYDNDIGADAWVAVIGGGLLNRIGAAAKASTIAGGKANTIAPGAEYAGIHSGLENEIGDADSAMIGGGSYNKVYDGSEAAAILGGSDNRIGTNSSYSAVFGGQDNTVGNNAAYAFAAGRRAKAAHPGAFVWADSQDADLFSTADNQFLIRAAGGVRIGSGGTVNHATGEGDLYVKDALEVDGTLYALGSIVSELLWVGTSTLHADVNQNRVGVGTTTPASRFHVVGGDVRIGNGGTINTVDGDGDLYVKDALEVDGTATISALSVGGASTLAGNLSADGSTLFVNASTDRVGIGTVIPGSRLHVVGGAVRVGSGGTVNDATGDGDLYVQDALEVDGTATITALVAGDLTVDSQTLFVNAADDRVGIGTASPGSRLHVAGGAVRVGSGGTVNFATGDGDLYVQDALEVDGTATISALGVGGVSALNGNLSVGGGTLFVNASTDRVGIGTASPGSQLHVAGGAVRVGSGGTVNAAAGDGDLYVQDVLEVDGNVYVDTSVLVVDSVNDRVGIKTDSPTFPLHVAGQAKINFGLGLGADPNEANRLKVVNNVSGIAGATVNISNQNASGIALLAGVNSSDTVSLLQQHGSGDFLYCDAFAGGWQRVIELKGDGTLKCKVLTITGGSDLAEPFATSSKQPLDPGMVLSIDPDHPGALRLADSAYDRCVAGIVSGAGGVNPGVLMRQEATIADGEYPVALSGRVYCWVDAAHGAVRPGDLLTTSDTPGHAMKATDSGRAPGAVLGKAMTGLAEGCGLVLVLVSLQ